MDEQQYSDQRKRVVLLCVGALAIGTIMLFVALYFWKRAELRNLQLSFQVERQTSEETVKKLNEIHQKEKKSLEENEAKLKLTLEEIKVEFQKKREELIEFQRKEANTLLAKYANDPNGLAIKLSEATGIPVHVTIGK